MKITPQEANRRIAERVFRYSVINLSDDHYSLHNGKGYVPNSDRTTQAAVWLLIPNFCGNADASKQLRVRLREMGWHWQLENHPTLKFVMHLYRTIDPDDFHWSRNARTEELAVAQAALAAVGEIVEIGDDSHV